MRAAAILASLAIAATSVTADQEIPLREKVEGWFEKAKAYIPDNVNLNNVKIPSPPNPIDAGAAKVAEYKVDKINIRNYERKLGPKLEGEEEWLVYLTGGNKSCFGRCGQADLAWNESVPLLAALPSYGQSKLKFGTINCDHEEALCTGWAAAVPAVWHFIFPQKDASAAAVTTPASPLHELRLNTTTVSVSDIVSIPRASKSSYLNVEEYKGFLHPVDGTLQKLGLLKAWGYVLWAFGTTPSWMIMVGISFFSRQFLSKRASSRPGYGGTVPPAAVGTGGKKSK